MGSGQGPTLLQEDLVVTLAYPDGSLAAVTYAENGHASSAKERLEILGRGHSVLIYDYKHLNIDGKAVKLAAADKGHVRSLEIFREVVQSRTDGARDLAMSISTTATMLAAAQSLATGTVAVVQPPPARSRSGAPGAASSVPAPGRR